MNGGFVGWKIEAETKCKMGVGLLIQWINSSVLMRKWLWSYKRKKQDEVC